MRSWRCEKWMPHTSPEACASVTYWARRPERIDLEVLSTPDSESSLTMLETVAGERPVAPASSTWVRPPCFLTASTMRPRLASRRDVCDPGVRRWSAMRPRIPAESRFAGNRAVRGGMRRALGWEGDQGLELSSRRRARRHRVLGRPRHLLRRRLDA